MPKRRSVMETSERKRGVRLLHLRSIRLSRNLTQEELGVLSRVSRESVYRLEGSRRGAMPGTVWRLASALGVQPDELVDGERRTWWGW
jgi:transcriptional regulator with XRE-family HTH domain